MNRIRQTIVEAARAIHVDRRIVEEVIDQLGRDMARKFGPKVSPGYNRNPVSMQTITLKNVRGEEVAVDVGFTTQASPAGDFALGGGMGYYKQGPKRGQPVVVINLNGKYPHESFMKGVGRQDVVQVLFHELTHSVDVGKATYKAKNKSGLPSSRDLNLDEYYNDPREVRAFMRELFETIAPSVRKVMDTSLGGQWGLNGTISRQLKSLTEWPVMVKYLTSSNRNRILKGLVTMFQDEGL